MSFTTRLDSKVFQLQVKQHRAVLDFVTDLEEAMGRAGVSQQDLATALDKSRSWISKVLRKKPNLTFFTAVELADSLGMELKVSLAESAGAKVSVSWDLPFSGADELKTEPLVFKNVLYPLFEFPSYEEPKLSPYREVDSSQKAVG